MTFIDAHEYKIDDPAITAAYVAYALDSTEYVGGMKSISYNMVYGGQPPNPLTINRQPPKKNSFRFCNMCTT